MKTIKRTRIELFIPDIPGGISKEVLDDLIEIAGIYYKGCTIIESIKGYYRSDKPLASTRDNITIIIMDIKYTIEEDPDYVDGLIKKFAEFINFRCKEDVVYYSYYTINAPDF